jgi:GH43 family beta-xylosidase
MVYMYKYYKMKYLLFFFFFSVIGCAAEQKNDTGVLPNDPPEKEGFFANPLLPSGPDPWVIYKDGYYYYTHTLVDRIDLFKTENIADLKNAKVETVWSAPETGINSKNIWAPELHFLEGKWYLYYTAGSSADLSTQRTFVLENSAEDPLSGTWVDKGKVYDPAADFFAIDGSILTYDDQHYFLWSGHASATDNTQRLYIASMENPWTLASPRVLISSPRYGWEQIGLPSVNEGPEILKNGAGKVFLIYSASGCWTDDYALGMLSLKKDGDPLDPEDWEKFPEPVFSKNPENKAFGPGHNGFFKSPDGTEDWIIYHANSKSGEGCGNARSPRAQQFFWNDDGTPDFGEPVKIYEYLAIPSESE